MKYMNISVVKEEKNNEKGSGFIKNHQFYSLKWFKNPAFNKSKSLEERKAFIRKKLSEVDLSERKFGKIFDEKERVIVNVQGKYGVDNAIFDEEMSMPDNLIDSNKNNDKEEELRW